MTAPAVLTISSHVGRGAIGNRAIVFALEALGVEAWAATTVSLPFHPGHGPAGRIVPHAEQFGRFLDQLLADRTPDLVLTGYFADAGQVEFVATRAAALKAANPQFRLLCDPVIGDSSGLYVSEPVAAAIRDRLLPQADFATPNRYELAWLAGRPVSGKLPGSPPGTLPESLRETAALAGAIGVPLVVVTSAPSPGKGMTGNLLVGDGEGFLCEHPLIEGPRHGAGDLTAGLLAAHLASGLSPRVALERTTASVFEMMAISAHADEIVLAGNGSNLTAPKAVIAARAITTRARR
jgi:pyridoxine kinase